MKISCRTIKILPVVCSVLAAVFFFNSCRKGTPSWDVDVLAPLVKSTLTINNIIPDSLLHKNPDNSLEVVYNTSLTSFSTVTVPDTTIDTVYFSPFTLPVKECTQIIPAQPNENKFNVTSVQLTEIIIHSGKLQISLENKTRKIMDVRYRIPSASLNTIPFDKTVSVPAKSGSTAGKITSSFDLSNYKFDLTGQNHNKVNTLMTETSVSVNCNDIGQDTIFPFTDNVKVSNSFIGIVPQYAKGYFGSAVTTMGPDSTTLSLFSHVIDGALNLQNINIDLDIENSVGADARVTIENLFSTNSRTGSMIPLSHPVIGNPININRAADNGGTVTPSLYKISFTPSNSNIKLFVENLPDKMSYKVKYEINPLGNVSGGNDFIYYRKSIKTDFNMTIPLSLIANHLTLADTLDFKMDSGTNNVNYGNLYVYADNGFPFSAEAQLYLMNDKFIITDSLISIPNTILAPSLDGNFICKGQQATKLAIPANQDKMNELRAAKKMYLKLKFNTAGQPNYVKIYSFYKMDVKIVGDFNYTVNKKN